MSEEGSQSKPVLAVQTVYFHESDRTGAMELGRELYERLTRPALDPLAPGPAIPVAVGVSAERVDTKCAERLVLIPVLGRVAFSMMRKRVLDTVAEWHGILGPGHVLSVPVAPVWRSAEDELPGKQLLTELYPGEGAEPTTVDEIVLATTRLLEPDPSRVRLFVSHAKADMKATGHAAQRIYDYAVTTTTGSAFFDVTGLRAGEALPEQLFDAAKRGVFVAVHGDSYSSRVWCQRELLTAKLNGLPTLTVEILQRGEQRSSPYAGNGPSLVWKENPSEVVSRAMIEWLRCTHFRLEGKRIAGLAKLPADVVVVARPPELLDLAQGPLKSGLAQLVLHPDPELAKMERDVLRTARPRLHFVTPTTAFRRLLSRESGSGVRCPLEGMQVALSLSDSPDANGPDGFTEEHVRDATVQVARSLVSAGAAIAYGGDFRVNGFTPLLAELIQAYNESADRPAEFLHSYLAAPVKPEDAPADVAFTAHHLIQSPDTKGLSKVPAPSDTERHPDALYYSDMRRVMADLTSARVLLGGAAKPRLEEKGTGYGGRYPGVVEEAWWTLKVGKPLYVLGGFGGAAALVAELLRGRGTPERLQDKTWTTSELFAAKARAIDADPYRGELGLPCAMEDLATEIRDLRDRVGRNGLTPEENELLFASRDPALLAVLVLKGLLNVATRGAGERLEVELVHGSVTAASNLDAIAVAAFDGVPLGGAGAVLDKAVGGKGSAARAKGRALTGIESAEIDADWLYIASLGSMHDVQKLEDRVEQATRDMASASLRHGLRRLGLVTFGGSFVQSVEPVVTAMLRGLVDLRGRVAVAWFETDESRFDVLKRALEASGDAVKLTTRRATAVPDRRSVSDRGRTDADVLLVQVNLEKERLHVTALPPAASSNALAVSRSVRLTREGLTSLAAGGGPSARTTPPMDVLKERGAKLARLLFGDDAAELLARCAGSRVAVVHDVPASRIPFEMLDAGGSVAPARQGGISRRLAVPGVPVDRLFARPPKPGRLTVLLVENPTEDLEGAAKEAERVAEVLRKIEDRVSVKRLTGSAATKDAFAAALSSADVLHYCGHAFFDGPGARESGLILANEGPFTREELARCPSLPRVSFVNACEAGRVRGRVTSRSAAFAEFMLTSGVEVYLGTYWEVGDRAAADFAAGVYERLAAGKTLDRSVTEARAALYDVAEPDWANYVLYGDAHFRLVGER